MLAGACTSLLAPHPDWEKGMGENGKRKQMGQVTRGDDTRDVIANRDLPLAVAPRPLGELGFKSGRLRALLFGRKKLGSEEGSPSTAVPRCSIQSSLGAQGA